MSTLSLLNSVGTRDQIEILQGAIKELEYRILYRGLESNKRLYTEITGKEPEDAEGHYYFDEILDSHGRIRAWLDRNRTAREENLAGATPDDLSGSNMFSLVTIFEMMENDLTEVGLLTVETDVTADFLTANFARGVILSCLKLALWGIFLPTLFLISPSGIKMPLRVYETLPNWISGYEWAYHSSSVAIQVVILLAVTFYTLRLFLIMLIDISTAVPTMENLLSNSNTDRSGSSSRDHDGQAGSSWSKRSMTYLFKWVFSESIVHSNKANSQRRKD